MTGWLIGLHVGAAVAFGVAAVGGALVGLAGTALHRDVDRWLDRSILLLLAGVAGAILVGLVMLLQGLGPRDPLHLLYAAAALATVPLVRAWRHGATPASRAGWLAAACLLSLAMLARLAMTA